MKTQRPFFVAIVFVVLLCSDVPAQEVDGGPCSYTVFRHPATIIAIDSVYGNFNEITFLLETGSVSDTLYYSFEFGGYISDQELIDSQFNLGDVLVYLHKQIESGFCTPDIYLLTKDKFE